jgi:hypothetical protein
LSPPRAVQLTELGMIAAVLDGYGALGPEDEPHPNGFDDLMVVLERVREDGQASIAFGRLLSRWANREAASR